MRRPVDCFDETLKERQEPIRANEIRKIPLTTFHFIKEFPGSSDSSVRNSKMIIRGYTAAMLKPAILVLKFR